MINDFISLKRGQIVRFGHKIRFFNGSNRSVGDSEFVVESTYFLKFRSVKYDTVVQISESHFNLGDYTIEEPDHGVVDSVPANTKAEVPLMDLVDDSVLHAPAAELPVVPSPVQIFPGMEEEIQRVPAKVRTKPKKEPVIVNDNGQITLF